MNTPVTTKDERYSDPEAAATGWDETRRALETAELFWISTVRADGRPHVTPLVAVWVDGALHFCTGATEQKAVNLRTNPHVILTTGCNDWDRGLDVVVEGDAIRVTDQDTLTRLARAWGAKWDSRWHYQVRDGSFYHQGAPVEDSVTGLTGEVLKHEIHVFSVTPTQIAAHAKGDPFSYTSHKF